MRKRILSILSIVILFSWAAMAVPAYSGKMKVRQGDGSWLTITLRGDEYAHVALTIDGYPVAWNQASSSYEYAKYIGEDWVPSGVVASDPELRDEATTSYLKDINKEGNIGEKLAQNRTQRLKALKSIKPQNLIKRTRISDVPTIGKQKALVLLVEFSDRKFSMQNPQAFYKDLLNKDGYYNEFGANGSARDFYIASSNGNYLPDFDVYGPIQVTRSSTYYGVGGGTQNVPSMIVEAIKKADEFVDFSQYDTDGDGYVDNVYVFYAGYGQADSHYANTIWPHSYNLENAGKAVSLDGKIISQYACSQEINGQADNPVGIGTFVHEFGHVLGLADHYDTKGDNYSLGDWDTMSSGSYTNNQNTPPLFSAFERAELGWLNYTSLDADGKDVYSLKSLAQENKAYRVAVPNSSHEYFILENRQNEGWDKYLPGHGMLVWHVDMDEAVWRRNELNVDANHPHLYIVPADSVDSYGTMDGDAFPGTKEVKQAWFNDWNQNYVFGFDALEEMNGLVSFAMAGSKIELETPSGLKVTELLGKSAKLSWKTVTKASFYQLELWQDSHLVKSWQTNDASPVILKDLVPETSYELRISAGMAQFSSGVACLQFTTLPLQFVEKKVVLCQPAHLTESSITARWNQLEGSDNYLVSLFEHQMTGTGSESCNFDDAAESLPSGWTTSCGNYVDNIYGQAPYALKMTKDLDYLLMRHHGVKFTHLKFWLYSYHDKNQFTIEQAIGGKWQVAQTIDTKRSEPKYVEMDLEQADSVRIIANIYKYLSLIDDVSVDYICDEMHPIAGKTCINVGKRQEYTFDGLEKGKTYSYAVVARNAFGEETQQTDFMTVTLDDETIANGIHEVKKNGTVAVPEVYDLHGNLYHGTNLPKGIYVVKKGNQTRKIIVH